MGSPICFEGGSCVILLGGWLFNCELFLWEALLRCGIGLLCRDDEHPQVMVGCLAATAASMANRMMGFWVDVLKDLFG